MDKPFTLQSPDQAYNAATRLMQSGQLQAAEAQYRNILEYAPDHGFTHHGLGLVLSQTGRLDEAQKHFEKAAQTLPDPAPAWRDLGTIALQKGDLSKAESLYRKSLSRAPEDANTLSNLGVVLMRGHDYPAAEQSFRKALALTPDYADAHENLGMALVYQKDRLEEAAQHLDKARGLNPGRPEIYVNLATLLVDLGRFEEAETCLRDALAKNFSQPQLYLALSIALQGQNRVQEAYDALTAAIAADPRNALAHFNMLALLDLMQDKAQIEKALENARRMMPDSPALPLMEARAANVRGEAEKAIEILEKSQTPPGPLAVKKAFALGHLYDRAGAPDKAYTQFLEANTQEKNSLQAKAIDTSLYPKVIDLICDYYEQESARDWPAHLPPSSSATTQPSSAKSGQDRRTSAAGSGDAERTSPVFLIGFPRSGTTLTGQILHSHPDVSVADEIMALDMARGAMRELELDYPWGLDDLTPAQILKLRQVYFDKHTASPLWQDSPVFVDKFPFNMAHAGMIYRLFPGAKFVFVQRHPLDCVLSCFMQNFRLNPALIHFTSIAGAARLYCQVTRCWELQQNLLPLDVHTVRYEDLTADFEPECRKLLAFCGLEWHDSVLSFHKQAQQEMRTITPSYTQITQEIYQSAAYRWEKYREYLEPAIPELQPFITRQGY